MPNPKTRSCVKPFHDPADVNVNAPHTAEAAVADGGAGKMDGFIREFLADCREQGEGGTCADEKEVMGYKTGADIPNYWAYARRFVLQDHMFESVRSQSLQSHLYLVSAWSAICKQPRVPATCVNDIEEHEESKIIDPPGPAFGWTDLTYLLHKYGVT